MGTRWSYIKPGAGTRRGSSRKPLDSRAFENCILHQLNQTVKQKILKKSVTLSPPPGNPGDMRHVLWPRSRLAQRPATWAVWDRSAVPLGLRGTNLPLSRQQLVQGAQRLQHLLCGSTASVNQAPASLPSPPPSSPGCPHKLLKALHVRLRFPGP